MRGRGYTAANAPLAAPPEARHTRRRPSRKIAPCRAEEIGRASWIRPARRPHDIISSSFAQGDRLRHELYIDSGDAEQNTHVFAELKDQQLAIEAAYGRLLLWEDLPKRRACRITDYNEGCSVTSSERHEEYIDWFIDAGTRLGEALSKASLGAVPREQQIKDS